MPTGSRARTQRSAVGPPGGGPSRAPYGNSNAVSAEVVVQRCTDQMKTVEDAIKRLIENVLADFRKGQIVTNVEFMQLYTVIHKLSNSSEQSLQAHQNEVQKYLRNYYRTIVSTYLSEKVVPSLEDANGEEIVRQITMSWRRQLTITNWLRNAFSSLDSCIGPKNDPHTKELRELSHELFRDKVFLHFQGRVRPYLLAQISRHRDGETVDIHLLQQAIQVYVDLGICCNMRQESEHLTFYRQHFENEFLDGTEEHYRRLTDGWISSDSCPEFLRKAEEKLGLEEARVRQYLHPSTRKELIRRCERVIVKRHQQELFDMENSGLRALLRNQKYDDMRRMYGLFSRLQDGLEQMALLLRDFIRERGFEVLHEEEAAEKVDPVRLITNLVSLNKDFSGVVLDSFGGTAMFQKALKDSFETIVNDDRKSEFKKLRKSRIPEMLADYADKLLSASSKQSQPEVDSEISQILDLFTYIRDKDNFMEFFRRHLAKRLLLHTANMEAVETLISKLKSKCGAGFTSKVEGMVTDIQTSESLDRDFQNWMKSNDSINLPLACSVQMLKFGNWPDTDAETFDCPGELEQCMNAFSEFYQSKRDAVKLQWMHRMGTAKIHARFSQNKARYEISCSTYQAIILLMFNESDVLTYGDILQRLNFQCQSTEQMEKMKDLVKRELIVLSSTRDKFFQLLVKRRQGSKESDIRLDDEFEYNEAFTSKKLRFKLSNTHNMKLTGESRQHGRQNVSDDRKLRIDAAMVRIMKARKQLTFHELVSATADALKDYFQPDFQLMKKRVEDLIEREFFERDDTDDNLLNYIS